MVIPYVVQPGDSLYYIAKMFCTSEDDVTAANQLVHPVLIQVGQLLYIPVSQPIRPMHYPEVIPPRDKLESAGPVAQQPTVPTTGTPAAPLQTMPAATPPKPEHPTAAPATTPPAQAPQTRIEPAPSPQDLPSFRYSVQAGDTLASLARRFGTTVDAMQQLNPPLSDPNRLPLGQSLLVPLPPRG